MRFETPKSKIERNLNSLIEAKKSMSIEVVDAPYRDADTGEVEDNAGVYHIQPRGTFTDIVYVIYQFDADVIKLTIHTEDGNVAYDMDDEELVFGSAEMSGLIDDFFATIEQALDEYEAEQKQRGVK